MERSWLGEQGGLRSNPHSANNWLGCWPSVSSSLWKSIPVVFKLFFFSSRTHFSNEIYPEHLHLDRIEAEVHWCAGN